MQSFKLKVFTEAFTFQETLGGVLVDPSHVSKKPGLGRVKAEFPTYCIIVSYSIIEHYEHY